MTTKEIKKYKLHYISEQHLFIESSKKGDTNGLIKQRNKVQLTLDLQRASVIAGYT
jgi:hypothetical protein